MVSIESIWNDLEELTKEGEKYESECDCTHINLQIDHKQGNEVCMYCGAGSTRIF